MVFEKCAVRLFPEKNCLSRYEQLLTPFAFSFVVKQFELSSKVKINERPQFIQMGEVLILQIVHAVVAFMLHIFALRSHSELSFLNQIYVL